VKGVAQLVEPSYQAAIQKFGRVDLLTLSPPPDIRIVPPSGTLTGVSTVMKLNVGSVTAAGSFCRFQKRTIFDPKSYTGSVKIATNAVAIKSVRKRN
jgi:hypothetical protein